MDDIVICIDNLHDTYFIAGKTDGQRLDLRSIPSYLGFVLTPKGIYLLIMNASDQMLIIQNQQLFKMEIGKLDKKLHSIV